MRPRQARGAGFRWLLVPIETIAVLLCVGFLSALWRRFLLRSLLAQVSLGRDQPARPRLLISRRSPLAGTWELSRLRQLPVHAVRRRALHCPFLSRDLWDQTTGDWLWVWFLSQRFVAGLDLRKVGLQPRQTCERERRSCSAWAGVLRLGEGGSQLDLGFSDLGVRHRKLFHDQRGEVYRGLVVAAGPLTPSALT